MNTEGTEKRLSELFQQGTHAYQAGQLEQAEQHYQQVLASVPNHADSLHLLGLLRANQQRLPEALELLGRALAVAPTNSLFYCNRAQVYRRLQQWDAAIQDYQQALSVDPRRAEIYAALAETYLLINRSQDAILHYLYACYLNPQQSVSTHHHLGNAFLSRGHFDAAILAYERALALNPKSIESLSNLGVIYAELRQWDQAVAYQQKALVINSHYGEAYINLGLALSQQGHFAEAEAAYQQALIHSPPQRSVIHSNQGLNQQAQGQWQRALDYVEQALKIDPHNAKARFNRATLLLLLGNYQQGWQEYEVRFQLNDPNHPTLATTQPNWQGEELKNKTILVYSEQGLGDTLQFVRYLPLLKQRGAHVILQTQPALIAFLNTQSSLGIDQCVATGQTPPPYDYYVPLMSLPQRFNTTLDTIPAAAGYLQVPKVNASTWPITNAALKIGLVWAGNPQHKNNHNRSLPLKLLEPLLENTVIQFYSLQCGLPPQEINSTPFKDRLVDLSSQLKSWIETAQLISQLDLIITVDTAVAHLSGALGKPTWMLLPFIPDFRWLLERQDSPWYHNVRLFRQPQRGDWASVIAALKQALEQKNNG
jgi:tetratricopeptide (TPR) repeat protein